MQSKANPPKIPPPLVNPAFITGNHAYGIPKDTSDVDLVILVEPQTLKLLVDLFGNEDVQDKLADYEGMPTAQLRHGRLNLIVSTTVRHYRQWQKGTKLLKERAPVTREHAVEVFKSIREEKDGH